MDYQIVVIQEVTSEPVSLDMQKAWSKIDSDYSELDSQISTVITSARKLLESQTNVGFAPRKLGLQWNGRLIEMPFSPTGQILEVLKNGEAITSDEYLVNNYQAKSILIKNLSCGTGSFFYGINDAFVEPWPMGDLDGNSFWDMYQVNYVTGYEVTPVDLKNAIMTQADFMIKRFGMPDDNEISTDALLLCSGYSRNPVIAR